MPKVEECQGCELAYKIVKGKTYFIKLGVETEEDAQTAFELIRQLDSLIGGFEFKQFLIVWTPGAGAKLYAIDSIALPGSSTEVT
jgi:hypothetical protein